MSEEITIKLKYLSVFQSRTGLRQEEISLSLGSSLATVAGWLSDRYGIIATDRQIMPLLNGTSWQQLPERLDTLLRDRDEVILTPLLMGG